jgi:hypothetical protein
MMTVMEAAPGATCDHSGMGADDSAEVRRILGQYKRLVLLGKAKIPLAEARRLVGPDTAFHLYFRHAEAPAARRRRRPAPSRSPRRPG